MHLSIPDTTECFTDEAKKRGQYTIYNMSCNGVYHCSLRYSQLLKLHTKLQQEFGAEHLEKFPPKQFFPLTDAEVEERRARLEAYIQKITEVPSIVNGATFTTFLLEAQEEVKESCEEIEMPIYLANGKNIKFDALSTDQTDEILERVCEEIGLDQKYTYYFGLFMVKTFEEKSNKVMRVLQHFESPYIALQRERGENHRIEIRKAIWDTSIEEEIIEDKVALNLLYVEAVQNIKARTIVVPKADRETLSTLKSEGSKLEFVQFCQKMEGYGHWKFDSCKCNVPEEDTEVTFCVGPDALYTVDNSKEKKFFNVKRIRCWRVLQNCEEFGFEYLDDNGEMVWIKVRTDFAILLGMCLQSVVDELLRLKQAIPIRHPKDRPKREKPKTIRKKVEPPPPEPTPLEDKSDSKSPVKSTKKAVEEKDTVVFSKCNEIGNDDL
eukprot:m.77467 g.77467  ORF g.77467 m.77467 type:complete len:437 (-) comp12625_c0_seq2:99-1409(-)